ncbi:hypothetical protein [Kitasatospora brasiliensis]|uniref:hypothetical protein n=1 Tax=Kitasatospora brasiliensis TaxID=3058040 RepID=UPI00292ED4AD|nr:hypothetical protein [Kitasatospora sp. K002]
MRELHSPPSPGRSGHRPPPGPPAGGGRWTPLRAVALIVAASGVAVLAACGSSPSGTATPAATSPNAGAFSGEPPSAVASAAESLLASASAAAASASAASEAAVASNSAAASAFEASVSAQQAMTREKSASVLSGVTDGGNAQGDITITGIARQNTGGLNAVVVTMQNRGNSPANYAVQVDFVDAGGKAVDSSIVGAENVPPNGKAQPVAFSRQPADLNLTPVVVKAVRY